MVPVAARDPGLFPYPVVSKQHRTVWPNLAGWNHAIEGWGANVLHGWFGCKSVGQVVSTLYFRWWFQQFLESLFPSLGCTWSNSIQFEIYQKLFPNGGGNDFFPQQPHLSPPFFPAELQHIERRNFVGTQLEKAAEDANLEEPFNRGWIFVMTGQPYLPGKPAEKKTTMVTLR